MIRWSSARPPTEAGPGAWRRSALPGHAPGHLVFYEPHYRLLFAGDMVSTQTSIVIVPPQGDLTVYMESLRRLKQYPARLLLPAHGGATARVQETIDESIAHRQKREEMLCAALGPKPRTVAELALEMYRGVPEHLMKFAQLQVLAGLQKLARGQGPRNRRGRRSRLVRRGVNRIGRAVTFATIS